MLDSKIVDFAKRLIQADTKKRQRPFFDKLSQNEQELQLRGNFPDSSSRGKRRIRIIFTEELENRASVIWESLQRAHKALGSQLTDTLACDLKKEATQFLSETKKKLLEFMIKRPYFAKDDTANSTLDSAKNDACEKIDIEIDLYVNSLTNKPAETEQENKAINKPNGESHKIFGDKFEVWGLSINYKNSWHKIKNWPCVARGIKKIRKLFRR